ncbi:MAG: ATP-binding protein [Lachnospiraceae bacterium]|nr:ATP-binding protein [Lachnospiraceae bacterium]
MREKSKFFRSLRFCIMVIMTFMSITAAVVVETTIVRSYEDRAVSQRSIIVKNQSDMICNQLAREGYMENQQNEVIDSQIRMLTSMYGGRILLVDKNYRIIRDSYDLDRGNYLISREVIQCFRGNETSQYDRKNQYIEMTVAISDPESENKDIIGVMLISVSTVEINNSRQVLEQKGMLILVITVLLILIFGFILSGILVNPFEKITSSLEDMTDGYLDERLSVNDYLETELISDAFNDVLDRIRILDESRQEFVSNVSHELKTPLASMKVLADVLNMQEDVPVEQYREFMQDISQEIDRENSIITDLLSLVKMDKKAQDLNIDTVNINEMLFLVLKRLNPIAAKANVELILDTFRPINAEVDQTKLTLAFSNLVENAIKYNKPEGGWVRISLNEDSKYFYVTVADSGIGIPEEAQNHIFERFYRVDKSHSREIGGTGLGLAITRSAIVMHRGAIKVHSTDGEGTTFSVRIPLLYNV